MIIALEGEIFLKEPTRLGLKCTGVVYEVFISLQTSQQIQANIGEKLALHTTQIIREDAQMLFGFLELLEKTLFERLIKINGVGPKVAMAILSTYTPQTFAKVVESNDIKSMQRVPGIGPKSAGRILVELSGWSLDLVQGESLNVKKDSNLQQVILALESLGYKNDVIARVTKGLENDEVSAMVKAALKRLQTL
ncbi:Holliday junction branch migration protein RuvA [Helicobacter winghamensis]|uniref:Holliday junction branch migration complex subunit RuvA n=1 Tax=Helicobacter winghamensis TaxID=157268 RepID=A0A2N3PIP2_9HELI|nr:Holliday junction branch migration protein RuvA [Helicobacter winghamensis]EEO25232.1 Holliday junction DNA helicase RuvA [Helicobacter winghamensis ATCC BAA-430]PKT76279.1 Holliday junction DNA helicase RuvA [Helicobacter winghamensis]PKT76410.1 Holliday junction DNA helicase RuvA [Helicobacter winghamensis]PKT76541.1 Holliday junction DNA helicase RuvA [Helicobacter winghamensis]PKT80790.1 Holliday junction DNA helicase RuvA [Helicobacter winghamensis]